MKKIVFLASILALVCLLAFSVSAAEPDMSKESVTLSDGTVCPIWDTDGDALIWYISTANADDGYANYDYIKATSESIEYNCGWKGESIDGAYQYQLGATFNITGVDGNVYKASSVVAANLMDDVKVTSGYNIGQPITSFSKTFASCTNLQYFFFPLGTVSVNAETFKNCTNLKYCNLADLTELRQINSQAFGACTSLFAEQDLDLSNTKLIKVLQGGFNGIAATSITLPETFTTIGEWAFQSCKYAKTITFKGTITSINTNSTFKGCLALETIEGFACVFENKLFSVFGQYMFEQCKSLKNIDGIMENGILIIPEGITTIGALSFNECDQIKYIEFPSTITTLNQACFAWCDNLVLASFDKVDAKIRNAVQNGEQYTKVSFGNCGTFKGCPKLAVMCVPYGTTMIINRFVAQGCNSLTAFYMPDTVTSIGTNGGGQGPFCDAKQMYFVSEPFTVGQCLVDGEVDLTKLVLPEKPSVYFMPESLTTTEGHVQTNQYSKDGTIFRNCYALNDVIVFPESYVDYNARNAFEKMGTKESPKTVVFLGDMTRFVIPKNAQYVSFVLANKANKSPEDLGIFGGDYDQNNTNSYMFFCYDGSRYDFRIAKANWSSDMSANVAAIILTKTSNTLHVLDADATLSVDAGCETVGSVVTYCFCGTKMSSENVPALGHDFEGGEDVIVFGATLYDNAGVCTACVRGCGTNSEITDLGVVIEEKGYSSSDIGGVKSFTRGYFVNTELLLAYEEQTGTQVVIGFAFALADNIDTEAELELDSFKLNMELKSAGEEFNARELDYIVRYKTDAHLDTTVVIAGYYSINGKVTFSGEVETVSYNSVAGNE